jgi:hypothetical protein
MTIRTWQTELDRQNRTSRTGQAEEDRQNRTAKTGLPGQDFQEGCQDRTIRTGLPARKAARAALSLLFVIAFPLLCTVPAFHFINSFE